MSSYFIAQINIHDTEEYKKYLQRYDEVFVQHKGRVLVVDDNLTVLEGEWPYRRTVIIRFPNNNELRRWYDSAEYQELAKYRRRASEANIVAVEGHD